MAGSSLLALLDDIASILDDVSLMTKVAAKKTAGVLGDDLALNAQQVAGVRAEREVDAAEVRVQAGVVAQRPAAVALSGVGIEVHAGSVVQGVSGGSCPAGGAIGGRARRVPIRG